MAELSIVTWVGRDDNKPMGLSGGTGAMQIWADFINKVKPTAKPPAQPNRIEWKWVNRHSGGYTQSGSHAVKLPFVVGKQDAIASANKYLEY